MTYLIGLAIFFLGCALGNYVSSRPKKAKIIEIDRSGPQSASILDLEDPLDKFKP